MSEFDDVVFDDYNNPYLKDSLPQLSKSKIWKFSVDINKKGNLVKSKILRYYILLPIIFVVAMFLNISIRAFILEPFNIPSSSMAETLKVDDKIVVQKITPFFKGYTRGDIIVFRDKENWLPPLDSSSKTNWGFLNPVMTTLGLANPEGTQYLVKRLIGLPGDRVEANGDCSPIRVNGVEIDEPYVNPPNKISDACPSSIEFSVVVPKGKVWVMGDNREYSADSREHMDEESKGFIDENEIIGTYIFTLMGPSGFLHFPKDYRPNFK